MPPHTSHLMWRLFLIVVEFISSLGQTLLSYSKWNCHSCLSLPTPAVHLWRNYFCRGLPFILGSPSGRVSWLLVSVSWGLCFPPQKGSGQLHEPVVFPDKSFPALASGGKPGQKLLGLRGDTESWDRASAESWTIGRDWGRLEKCSSFKGVSRNQAQAGLQSHRWIVVPKNRGSREGMWLVSGEVGRR